MSLNLAPHAVSLCFNGFMANRSKQRFPQQKKAGATASKAAGDDRNLVLVDEDFQDADFEDRVWLFWQRHGRKTIAGAVALFLAIIAVIVVIEVKKMQLAALQADFTATTTAEQKLAFAAENSDEPLAGTAYFAVGAEFAEAGKYAESAQAFAKAAAVFGALDGFADMRDRALVAQAAATAHAGTPEALAEAQEILKKIAQTPTSDALYRGQAMYELATIALSAGDIETARLWLNEMDRALDAANVWQERKRTLILLEPALAAVPAAESAENAESAPAAENPAVPATESAPAADAAVPAQSA